MTPYPFPLVQSWIRAVTVSASGRRPVQGTRVPAKVETPALHWLEMVLAEGTCHSSDINQVRPVFLR